MNVYINLNKKIIGIGEKKDNKLNINVIEDIKNDLIISSNDFIGNNIDCSTSELFFLYEIKNATIIEVISDIANNVYNENYNVNIKSNINYQEKDNKGYLIESDGVVSKVSESDIKLSLEYKTSKIQKIRAERDLKIKEVEWLLSRYNQQQELISIGYIQSNSITELQKNNVLKYIQDLRDIPNNIISNNYSNLDSFSWPINPTL